MKKNCKNCRAFPHESYDHHCQLGFVVEREEILIPGFGYYYTSKPVEECSKPLTVKKFNQLLMERYK